MGEGAFATVEFWLVSARGSAFAALLRYDILDALVILSLQLAL